MQYTAASFTAPLVRAITVSGVPAPGGVRPGADFDRDDRVLHDVAIPVWKRLRSLASELRPMQRGRVTTYLQFIIGTVLLLLSFLFFSAATPSP